LGAIFIFFLGSFSLLEQVVEIALGTTMGIMYLVPW
jgi:hypothetical protein